MTVNYGLLFNDSKSTDNPSSIRKKLRKLPQVCLLHFYLPNF